MPHSPGVSGIFSQDKNQTRAECKWRSFASHSECKGCREAAPTALDDLERSATYLGGSVVDDPLRNGEARQFRDCSESKFIHQAVAVKLDRL